MSPRRVALITRTKNRTALLHRAIESVLGQTFAEWRHVIVNGGGDPAALDAMVSQYREAYQDDRISINILAS